VTAQLAVFDLGDRVDLVLDGGPAPRGRESTVVDLTGPQPRVVREGAVAAAELEL
jgi:L-threonylcarbamoyladenylate synthase